MDARIPSLGAGLAVGFVIGVMVVLVVTPPVTGTSVPSHGLTTATGCAEEAEPRAWVGVVPNADYRAVYLTNFSFVHDEPALEVSADLTEGAANGWVLAITTEAVESDKALPEECQPRTRLDASVALPTSTESLRVTLDGTSVATVETTANAPRFSSLDE